MGSLGRALVQSDGCPYTKRLGRTARPPGACLHRDDHSESQPEDSCLLAEEGSLGGHLPSWPP